MRLSWLVLLLMLASLQGVLAAKTPVTKKADVIVYGATPGGFCAAIAASREGATVILLEPTNHVGGVNTGGLAFSDSNQTVRSTVMGLFDEWHTRIEKDYQSREVKLPYSVAVKDQAKWTYEPHVAMRVTKQMLQEANVEVITERVLKSIVKKESRIVQLVTNEETFSGRVFIDATYEGDLMAAAEVSWTIGREGRAAFGESFAGKQYPKRKMLVSDLDVSDKPLSLITTTDGGPAAEGDANVMVYSFRLCLTADPQNRVPFPQPKNYDATRFEVVRRYLKTGGKVGFDLYELPGEKFDGNNSIGGQFSLGMVGAGNDWSESDQEKRAEIWEAHKQYTMEFYHFLTTDPAVPQKTRDRFAKLGLCKDEFVEHGHWSPQLYVREGRRLQGMYVVSQSDIITQPKKEDPIAISSFPIDSHDCQRIALPDGGVINEGTIFPVRMQGRRHGYPYQIPYRSIVPKRGECDNLLVPVAMSCTHVGISSIRVEPTWMIIGQSAGIAAAAVAELNVSTQDLPYSKLRPKLLAQQQILDLPELPKLSSVAKPRASLDPKSLPGIVLDNSQATLQGKWKRSSNFKAHVGDGYLYANRQTDGKANATFRFTAPKAGHYELRMAYSAHETRANNVPVLITSGAQQSTFEVNQTAALPSQKYFRKIGLIQLVSNSETVITVSNEGTNGFVILDALQLIPEVKK